MPYSYVNFGAPSQRPSVYQSAAFVGPDDDLTLEVGVYDYIGNLKTVSLPCTVPGTVGQVCLPSSADVTSLTDLSLIAAMRMSTLISDTVVGSTEWTAALLEGQTSNLQTAIGVCKVVAVRVIDQINVELDIRKNNTSSPTKTLTATRDQFPTRGAYVSNPSTMIDPETQARCIAGEIEKVFPSYVHDYPGTVLSSAQRTAICSHVIAMSPWV